MGNHTIRISRPSASATLPIRTLNDVHDEEHGSVSLAVQPGTGYTVSESNGTATVFVTDNDKPAKATWIRAHGDQTSRGVTIRWDGAKRVGQRYQLHSLRYAMCSISTRTGCNASFDEDWTVVPGVDASGTTVKEAYLPRLQTGVLYKVSVSTLIGGEDTGWSDYTLVYPTTRPLVLGDDVAHIPIIWHQPNGLLDYNVCKPAQTPTDAKRPYPIPSGLDVNKIRNAIWTVENAVQWRTGNANIIRSVIGSTTACEDRFQSPHDKTIAFYDTDAFEDHCEGEGEDVEESAGCVVNADGRRYIVLHSRFDWGDTSETVDCTRFVATIQHEALHVYGLGHADAGMRAALSNSWRFRTKSICAPTEMDVVAVMSVYQSRR